MRYLLYIPIMHSPYEYGFRPILRLKKALNPSEAEKFEKEIEELNEKANKKWDKIEEIVDSYLEDKDSSKVQVYQDSLVGLTKNKQEVGVFRHGRNYELLKKLKDIGTKRVVTEDKELLKKHGALELKNQLEGLSDQEEAERASLMKERDKYIARRINNNLEEYGILFIGQAHQSIQENLSDDIEVDYPEDIV